MFMECGTFSGSVSSQGQHTPLHSFSLKISSLFKPYKRDFEGPPPLDPSFHTIGGNQLFLVHETGSPSMSSYEQPAKLSVTGGSMAVKKRDEGRNLHL